MRTRTYAPSYGAQSDLFRFRPDAYPSINLDGGGKLANLLLRMAVDRSEPERSASKPSANNRAMKLYGQENLAVAAEFPGVLPTYPGYRVHLAMGRGVLTLTTRQQDGTRPEASMGWIFQGGMYLSATEDGQPLDASDARFKAAVTEFSRVEKDLTRGLAREGYVPHVLVTPLS